MYGKFDTLNSEIDIVDFWLKWLRIKSKRCNFIHNATFLILILFYFILHILERNNSNSFFINENIKTFTIKRKNLKSPSCLTNTVSLELFWRTWKVFRPRRVLGQFGDYTRLPKNENRLFAGFITMLTIGPACRTMVAQQWDVNWVVVWLFFIRLF